VAYFRVPYQNVRGRAEENYGKKNCQPIRSQGLNSNSEPPKQEAGMLKILQRHSVASSKTEEIHEMLKWEPPNQELKLEKAIEYETDMLPKRQGAP